MRGARWITGDSDQSGGDGEAGDAAIPGAARMPGGDDGAGRAARAIGTVGGRVLAAGRRKGWGGLAAGAHVA